MTKLFAEIAFDFQEHLGDFENTLLETGDNNFDFSYLLFDDYDCSMTILSVPNNARLNYLQQQHIFNNGFLRTYLKHNDGWQTHYKFTNDKKYPIDGWRVKYADDSKFGILQLEKQKKSFDEKNIDYIISFE